MHLARTLTIASLAFVAGGYAASKSYQFTGVVKAADGGELTVEKSAKETWQVEVSKDTKGTPKLGDKVAVHANTDAPSSEAQPSRTHSPTTQASPAARR